MSFNPCFNGYYTFTYTFFTYLSDAVIVSILVLMDITLLLEKKPQKIVIEDCFNPCFNGYYTFTN